MTTRELHHDRLVENTKTPHPMESVSSLLNKRKESVLGKVANSANHEKPLNCNYLNGIPQPQTLLASQWEQPIPLTQLPPPSPYPVDSLPEVLKNAVEEAEEITQAPTSMIACSALSVLSIASQAHFDVGRTPQLIGPISLYFLLLAESGERKSTVDKIFSKPIREYQKQSAIDARVDLANYEANFDSWTAQVEGIKSEIKKSEKKRRSTAELTEQLKKLYEEKPKRKKIFETLFHDVTTEKLLHHLAHNWPSVGIMSAEGAIFFGGRSMAKDHQLSALGVFNSLWSGEAVKSDRKTTSSAHVNNARLSMSLMVQPAVFKERVSESPVLRDIGFAARFLFCYPTSKQGERLFKHHKTETQKIDAFHRLVNKILSRPPEFNEDSLCPPIVSLNDDALEIWIQFFDEIEVQLGKDCEYTDIRDFASKIAENAARLAGVFQLTKEDPVLAIDADSMGRGIAIARWHLTESKRYFGTITDKSHKNAQVLSDWLIKKAPENKCQFLRTQVMQNGPECIRLAKDLNPALKILYKHRHIALYDGTRHILLNPNLMNQDQSPI